MAPMWNSPERRLVSGPIAPADCRRYREVGGCNEGSGREKRIGIPSWLSLKKNHEEKKRECRLVRIRVRDVSESGPCFFKWKVELPTVCQTTTEMNSLPGEGFLHYQVRCFF